MKIFQFGTTCLAAATMFLLSFVGFVEETNAGLVVGSSTFNRTLNGNFQGSMTYGDVPFFAGSTTGQTVFSTVGGNGSNFFIFFRSNSNNAGSVALSGIANGGGYGATGLSSYFPPGGITAVTINPLASGVTIGAITTNALAPTNGLTLHSFNADSFRTVSSSTISIGPSTTVGYEVSAVPEPTSLCLVGIGLIGCVVRRTRRKLA